MSKAEETSDLTSDQSDAGNGRKKRKRIRQIDSDDSSEESEVIYDELPPPPVTGAEHSGSQTVCGHASEPSPQHITSRETRSKEDESDTEIGKVMISQRSWRNMQ